MTGAPQSGPSELIVYIDHSEIREGQLEGLQAGVRRLVDLIAAREPRLIAYGFHLDEDAARMTVTAVHPDSASLELHLEVGPFDHLAHRGRERRDPRLDDAGAVEELLLQAHPAPGRGRVPLGQAEHPSGPVERR